MEIKKKITTTDATVTTVLTINADTSDAGVIEAHVVGLDAADGLAVTGAKIIRYVKASGTLTLGTPSNVLAVVADTGIDTATFAFAAVSNQIALRLTGVAAKTINWSVTVKHTSL